MKRIFTAILATLMIALTFTACTPEKEDLTFYMPDGAPALAMAKSMATDDFALDGHEIDFTVLPATSIQSVAADQPDLAIVPVNLASKLTQNYTIFGAITHGNLYLLGKTPVASANDLAGKSMSVVNLNAVPGLTLKVILAGADVTAGALTGATDAAAAVTALAEGQVDYALVPEPAATAQMNKHNNAATTTEADKWIKVDLQALYKDVFDTEQSYPQAVVVVNKRVELTSRFVAQLSGALQNNATWLYQNIDKAIQAVEDEFVDGAATTMKAAAFSASVIDGCNIAFKSASTSKLAIQNYIQKIIAINANAASIVPDTAFYGA